MAKGRKAGGRKKGSRNKRTVAIEKVAGGMLAARLHALGHAQQ
jgi:hypothetical protein